jgi:hypothetical protein
MRVSISAMTGTRIDGIRGCGLEKGGLQLSSSLRFRSQSSAMAPGQIVGEHAERSRTPTIRRGDKVRASAARHSSVEPQAGQEYLDAMD